MAFDKELSILYGFFNLIVSKKEKKKEKKIKFLFDFISKCI